MGESTDQVIAFLAEQPRIGRLATVSAEGVPHVVPVWFRVDGERLLVHTFGESRKARNIAATGRYSMTVDKDTLPYRGATVGGRAEVVGNDVIDSLSLVRDLAVAFAGPDIGPAMGDGIAGSPGEHVTLVLQIDTSEYWDHS